MRSHGAYQSKFVVDFAVLLLFEQRPVDDNVELVCASSQGHSSFLQLVIRVLCALVEANDTGDQDIASFEVGMCLGDIVGSDANALHSIALVHLSEEGAKVTRCLQRSWRLWPLRTARQSAWASHLISAACGRWFVQCRFCQCQDNSPVRTPRARAQHLKSWRAIPILCISSSSFWQCCVLVSGQWYRLLLFVLGSRPKDCASHSACAMPDSISHAIPICLVSAT